MIIEFNGLPGMGKTTVAQTLNRELSYNYDVKLKYRLYESKVRRLFSYLVDGSAYLYALTYRYTKYSTKHYKRDNLKYIQVLIAYYRMYRSFLKKHPNDILIVDQGMMQALVSIHYDNMIISTQYAERIFRFLNKKNITVAFVNCENDRAIAVQRIKERNTVDGRLDVCSAEEREKVLDVQLYNFDVLRAACSKTMKECKNLNINMNNDPERNSLQLMEQLGLKEGSK